ncbi:SDH family Clp fold serine proteinase [Pseudanabaena minima]|uniref:SDH family Clp fold serine proteinase n=1 Tax=Pseudanabaena minima TaxID=890415 RepID=UPI003DA8B98C
MSSKNTKVPEVVQICIQSVIDELDADAFLYSADISEENADKLIQTIRDQSPKRENVVLILSTYGGDPDAAYRIARILKQAYKKFTLVVFGYCKSAGTLVAIAADEIVMSDMAELGPLDVQLLKENDFRRSSGLDLQQALEVLRNEVFTIFERCFLGTVSRSGGAISTRMAAEMASSMAVGLLSPIASQIDPIRLGEVWRSMDVAYEYGIRLNPDIKETIEKLVKGYPAHGFVIDRKEAEGLFKNVRPPSDSEIKLERILYQSTRVPSTDDLIFGLDELLDTEKNTTMGDAENDKLIDNEYDNEAEKPDNNEFKNEKDEGSQNENSKFNPENKSDSNPE